MRFSVDDHRVACWRDALCGAAFAPSTLVFQLRPSGTCGSCCSSCCEKESWFSRLRNRMNRSKLYSCDQSCCRRLLPALCSPALAAATSRRGWTPAGRFSKHDCCDSCSAPSYHSTCGSCGSCSHYSSCCPARPRACSTGCGAGSAASIPAATPATPAARTARTAAR